MRSLFVPLLLDWTSGAEVCAHLPAATAGVRNPNHISVDCVEVDCKP